ncbi:hypothetical protein PG985_007970 [Apiospora marii]|uniref:uncharacterized protein n=1 Tax=Apiospora marii TaxID=335849 RepID=UPI00312F9531
MDTSTAINNAAKQVRGLNFGRGRAFNNPKVVFAALVGDDDDEGIQGMTLDEITAALEERLFTLVTHATRGHDVFTRLRGHSAFYSILLSLEEARQRDYSDMQIAGTLPKSKLMLALDDLLGYLENDNALERDDHTITLKPQPSSRRSMLSGPSTNSGIRVAKNTIWPPVHLSSVNIAHLCQHDVHKDLYGITPQNLGTAPTYPTDQSGPITVRRFLSYETLTKSKPSSSWALYPAPVAFLADQSRGDWYKVTGHQSRFYSTLAEFLDYAKQALRHEATQRVLGLLTPWFYETGDVMALSNGHLALPVTWEQMCFRSGMAIIVDKHEKTENGRAWKYQVVVFQPQAPRYPRAAPSGPIRNEKRDQFVDQLFADIAGTLRPVSGRWIGGTLKPDGDNDGSSIDAATIAARGVQPDSVELSSALISELTEDPDSLATDAQSLSTRGFRNIGVREIDWDA